MSTELIRGQNLPLPGGPVEVNVAVGSPVTLLAALTGADGRVRGEHDVLLGPGTPVEGIAFEGRGVVVDPARLPGEVERVLLVATLEGGAVDRFGLLSAPVVTVRAGGAPIAGFTIADLAAERAVQLVELYLRQGVWKLRALGQGYDTGLEAFLRDVGLASGASVVERARRVLAAPPAPAAPVAPATPPAPVPAPSSAASRPPAGDGLAWAEATPEAQREAAALEARRAVEKLYDQVWGVFEDAARSAAAYRSAVDFADGRLDRDLEEVLSEPSARFSPAGLAAQEQARARSRELAERAKAGLDRDTAQLVAEVAALEPALPPVMARWDSPVWATWQAPEHPAPAVRLGDLHLPERPELRIPMVLRMPMERGLWIDNAAAGLDGAVSDRAAVREQATGLAAALAARMLTAFPVGDLKLHVIDPEGKGASAAPFQPLVAGGLLSGPVATSAAEISSLLGTLTDRVELVRMAVDGGATDALPPDLDLARRLLLVHDFPFGFDDRGAARLRHIVEEGARVGVHVMVVGNRSDAESFGPLLDPLWRALLRVTPVPEDHIMDPWVGLPWVYTPDLPSGGADATRTLLSWLAATPRA